MPAKKNLLPGCTADIAMLDEMLVKAFNVSTRTSLTSFQKQIVNDGTFMERMRAGRVSPRKMKSAHDALRTWLAQQGAE